MNSAINLLRQSNRKDVVIFFFYSYDEETDTTVPVPVDDEGIENAEELEFFFDDKVRKVWHKQEEEWYFSVVDVCQVLTDQDTARGASTYWAVLKKRLKEEGADELLTNCKQLKMKASDGKMRKTDAASTEQLLRIIQSIPSKKAEPFKQWLAQVGKERLDEIADPELAFERAIRTYRQKGYTDAWIQERLKSINIRKELTDEWSRAGAKSSRDFATLTNVLTQAWSGKSVRDYKEFKGLHKENLRDNMTNIELSLNQLAEVSATLLSKARNPKGFHQSKDVTIEGGSIAGNARRELEEKLGRSVISPLNASDPPSLDETEEPE